VYIQWKGNQYVIEALHHPRFIAAPLTIANTGNQLRCLPVDKWIKTMWYNEILFSHKKNTILSLAAIWMELEDFMLSKMSQAWKKK
jgi:hypothetical protein